MCTPSPASLHISQGVGLPLTVSTPKSTGLASKLTDTGQGEELLQPRKHLTTLACKWEGTPSFTSRLNFMLNFCLMALPHEYSILKPTETFAHKHTPHGKRYSEDEESSSNSKLKWSKMRACDEPKDARMSAPQTQAGAWPTTKGSYSQPTNQARPDLPKRAHKHPPHAHGGHCHNRGRVNAMDLPWTHTLNTPHNRQVGGGGNHLNMTQRTQPR